MKLEKILKNRYVYYVAVFLMVLNVLGYVANGSMECVIIFALSTYLSNQFLTKNPTLDILVGLLVSNALFGCKSAVKEGMEGVDGVEKQLGHAHSKLKSKEKHEAKKATCTGSPEEIKKCQAKAAAAGAAAHKVKQASVLAKHAA